MNGACIRKILLSRLAKRPSQLGCIGRLAVAIRLLRRGHSWRFAWREAGKAIK